MIEFKNPEIENVFYNFKSPNKEKLLEIRELIFEVAKKISTEATNIIIDETLK